MFEIFSAHQCLILTATPEVVSALTPAAEEETDAV